MSIRPLDLKRNLIVMGSFFAWFLIQFGFLAYRGGIASVPAITYVMLAVYPVFGLYLYRNRRRNKIISWPDGFQFVKRGAASRVYAWNEIESLRQSRVNGWVYLSLHDGTEKRLFGSTFFGSNKKTARFVKETNELREEYARRGQ